MSDVKVLSQFEANLVLLARFFVGRLSVAQAMPLLLQALPRPRCLSRACVLLVQETLARGCVQRLARSGGWRRVRFMRAERIAEGRLWERTPPCDLALHFSRQTLELLIWLTATCLGQQKVRARPPSPDDATMADRLFSYLVYSGLRETNAVIALPGRWSFAREPLCWLAFPDDFWQHDSKRVPEFSRWFQPAGMLHLEALQLELARHAVQTEQRKRGLADWQRFQAVGQIQERVIAAYLDTCESAGRRDLAVFLLMALREILEPGTSLKDWVSGLESPGRRMADRAATEHAALTPVRAVRRLQSWDRQARLVSYFDEGYAASQLWKSLWEENHGEELCKQADVLYRTQRMMPLEETR